MRLDYVTHWEYNDSDSLKDFIKYYELEDIFYERLKDQLAGWVGMKVTKKSMNEAMTQAENTGYLDQRYDILDALAEQYLITNNLFDQVFFVEFSDDENLYRVSFYYVVPNSQADLKQFFEKHLDAYKNGFGEVVEDVIERRSRNTPK